MGLSSGLLIGFTLAYFILLLLISHFSSKQKVINEWIQHPMTYVLTLGIFASTWSLQGIIGLADLHGYGFLAHYLGLAGMFLFAPLILIPLLRICRNNMLSSLADLLAFRFRSQLVGAIITLVLIITLLPLIALQIDAIANSLQILHASTLSTETLNKKPLGFGLLFCVIIGAYTIIQGFNQLTAYELNEGLVITVVVETLLKLFIFSTLGFVAVYGIFGGFIGLEEWLITHQDELKKLTVPMRNDATRSLLLIFFSAAVVMPQMFYIIFTEHVDYNAMRVASWGFPILLMLMSLPVLPLLWANIASDTLLTPNYALIALGDILKQPFISILAYIALLAAASSTIVVSTLALASMSLKHLFLPFYRPSSNQFSENEDIYLWLRWLRRILVVVIITLAYLFFCLTQHQQQLNDLGLTAFIGAMQFIPALFATLFWRGANRYGLIAGLCVGFGLWFFTLFLPVISNIPPLPLPSSLSTDLDLWSAVSLMSLGANATVFVIVSLITPTRSEEISSAELCSSDDISRPQLRSLSINNPKEMKLRLSSAIGPRSANREVDLALAELNFTDNESRPFALRQLRQKIEVRLSALLGPSVSHAIVEKLLSYENNTEQQAKDDINLIEKQLEKYEASLTGLAADLDSLRRYHRQTLQDLPVGVCILSQDFEILLWNQALANLTDIQPYKVVGSLVDKLPDPWGGFIHQFCFSKENNLYKQSISINDKPRWLNMHKNSAESARKNHGLLIVIEDISDLQLLESKLTHSERLASIGRLAAGVAHEIGNPVTGIACLAQNLRYDTENPESLETAKEILQQTDRITTIVQSLVNFAHSGSEGEGLQLSAVNIKSCVDEAIKLLTLDKDAKTINYLNHCPAETLATAHFQRLIQVFINLLNNARDASPEHSDISISCEQQDEQVLIHITDQGEGIPVNKQKEVFDPFFTTKPAGQGTGLGLALVHSIMTDLGGNISVTSPPKDFKLGTTFTLSLGAIKNNQH